MADSTAASVRVLGLAVVSLACVIAADPVRDVTYTTPIELRFDGVMFDNGYLVERRGWLDLLLFGRDGVLIYGTRPKLRHSGMGVGDTAVDTDGTMAASVVYRRPDGTRAGAIAIWDPSGKQIHTVYTGRYMPKFLCITPGHYLWTLGWVRGEEDDAWPDTSDYFVFRRYTLDGQETGRFVKRSEVAGLSDVAGFCSNCRVLQASGDRLGVLIRRSVGQRESHWAEFDIEGQHTKTWNLGRVSSRVAFTVGGELYRFGGGRTEDGQPRLQRFNKIESSWDPLDVQLPLRDIYGPVRTLMGADQNSLVVANPPGGRLLWIQVE